MNNSFVFYKSFFDSIQMLPTDMERCDYLKAICNLAFYNIEPDLTDKSLAVQLLYTVTSEQIKASIQHKIDGAKGGKQKGINAKTKNTPLNTPLDTNVNVNVNANSNENVNLNENENVNTDELPNPFTPSTTEYSNIIFNLYKDAGLPCCKNNSISFLQVDFKNALNHLHITPEYEHIHSDDVIGAVKNYIEVLNSPKTYYKVKMNFYSFVKSKGFYNFLPANYDFNSYIKFEAKDQQKEEPKKLYSICPVCKQKKMYTIHTGGAFDDYFCDSCNKRYTFKELEAYEQ